MRLFIAVEIPDDLKRELTGLRVYIPGARLVPWEQMHLTLAFLGDVDEMQVERLVVELSQINLPGFDLCFSRTGCFPDFRRPRVLWIGLKNEPALNALAEKVRYAVLACGIPLEERSFSPHITLARLKKPAARETAAFLAQPDKKRYRSFRVSDFKLFQSQLTPHGAVHSEIKSFPLGAE